MASRRYTPLPISADLAQSSLEVALVMVGTHASYDLHVHPNEVDYALKVVPFLHTTPEVTIVPNPALRPHEWYVQGGSVAVGSSV